MERTTHVVGQSGAFLDALEHASRAAALDRPVLVIGERGTGKELVAERLHRLSPRWDQPLVVMNCAALPETLIEAELFGHEAGSFTGATKGRAGRFEEADGGTLFLDELGTLSMAAQDRLLRAVEYGEITRIGASRPMRVDVRIVAATNEHLPERVERGTFRADLLDRLSFEVVTLPPLRARAGDVLVLAEFFGRRMAAELGRDWEGFGPTALDGLTNHDWPGNVRELENTIQRACALCNSDVLLASDIPLGSTGSRHGNSASTVTRMRDALTMLLNTAQNSPDIELLPWVERELSRMAYRHYEEDAAKTSKLLGITSAELQENLGAPAVKKATAKKVS